MGNRRVIILFFRVEIRFEGSLQSLRYVFSLGNFEIMIFNSVGSKEHSLLGLMSKGLGTGAGWERGGSGDGRTLSREAPPPRLSRMGALRAGSLISAPIRDNRGGGGDLSRKGVLSSLLYQPF